MSEHVFYESPGEIDTAEAFALGLKVGLEDFHKALQGNAVLPCLKAVQAAINLGAEEVKIRQYRDGLTVTWQGDGGGLSRALLDLPGTARLTPQPGLPRYLSWALWGSIADGAQSVSWRIGSEPNLWVLSYRPQEGWSTPDRAFAEDGPVEVVWSIAYPWKWSWSNLSAYLVKNRAMQDLPRHFAFAPVAVKVDNRTVNRGEVWPLMGLARGQEALADAYTLLSRDPVRFALSPPAPHEPHKVWLVSGQRVLHNAQSHHTTSLRYGFYGLEHLPEDQLTEEPAEIPLLQNSASRCDSLRTAAVTNITGVRAAKAELPALTYRMMGVKLHAFIDPERCSGGGVYLIQDGLIHKPLLTDIPGFYVLVAGSGHLTDASGLVPVGGPAMEQLLSWVVERLDQWHRACRSQSFWDGAQEVRWAGLADKFSSLLRLVDP